MHERAITLEGTQGPILGVLVFWGLQTALADYGSWYLLSLGLIAIVADYMQESESGDL